MIGTKAFCGHIKMTFAEMAGSPLLSTFIGKMNNLTDGVFIKRSSEINLLISLLIQESDIDSSTFSTFSFDENVKHVRFTTPSGVDYIPNVLVTDPFFKYILFDGPATLRDTKHLACLLKLKTAVLPRSNEEEPDPEIVEKHRKSISGPFEGNPQVLEDISSKVEDLTMILLDKLMSNEYTKKSFLDREYFTIARTPITDKSYSVVTGPMEICTVPRSQLRSLNINHILRVPEFRNYAETYTDEFVSRVIAGEHRVNTIVDLSPLDLDNKEFTDNTPLQSVRFIPNPAGKERVVTVSNVLLQCLTYNIGRKARYLCDLWPVQGVKSHDQTTQYISSLINNNKSKTPYYSIDMSNFTDRLPKQLSRSILLAFIQKGICDQAELKAFDLVCNTPVEFKGDIIKYEVGTPQGTFPSFPLASLANGMIATIATIEAYNLSYSRRLNFDAIPARVIGDDIVVFDPKVAKFYMKIMNDLGVEISPQKSIISPYYAEMCSKLIDHNGVYQQKKIDTLYDMGSIDQLKSQYEYYGDELVNICPQLEPYIKRLKDLPKPYGLTDLDDTNISDIDKYIYINLYDMSRFFKNEVCLNSKDIDILLQRRNSIKFIYTLGDGERNDHTWETNPLTRSLYRDLGLLLDKTIKECLKFSVNYDTILDCISHLNRLKTIVTKSAHLDTSTKKVIQGVIESHIKRNDSTFGRTSDVDFSQGDLELYLDTLERSIQNEIHDSRSLDDDPEQDRIDREI